MDEEVICVMICTESLHIFKKVNNLYGLIWKMWKYFT